MTGMQYNFLIPSNTNHRICALATTCAASAHGADLAGMQERLTDLLISPFVMTVKSIKVTDGSTNVTNYAYGDQTGSYESITSTAGESKAFKLLNKKTTTESAKQSWEGLSTGAKVGVACGIGGAFAIGIIAFCTFCLIQRRRGKKERKLADEAWDNNQAELMEYQSKSSSQFVGGMRYEKC